MKIFLGFLIGAVIVMFIYLAYNAYMIFKNENTFKQRMKIIKAIHAYFQSKKAVGKMDVSEIEYMYHSVEPYDNTLNRRFDWGYKNIVPPDVYEKIEQYIGDNYDKNF